MTRRVARRHVEIFPYVDQHDEAIAIADRFSVYEVVEPVVGTAWETHPQWTIDACKVRAEPIIGEGQLQPHYAVNWLEIAGKAAEAAGELDEWRTYAGRLQEEHYQKYRLRPTWRSCWWDFPDSSWFATASS